MQSNPKPPFLAGTTAEQPAAALVPIGTTYFNTQTLASQICVLMGTSRVWSVAQVAEYDIDLYLDATNGNDSNDGKSAQTAWKTADPLLAFFASISGYTGHFYIHSLVSANYTFTPHPNSVGFQYIVLPAAVGPNATQICWIGPRLDTGMGTRTIQSIATVTRAGQSCKQFVDAAGAVWTAHAQRGASLRVTSGAATGKCATIEDNATSSLTGIIESFTGVAPGDTFVVERPGAVLLIPSGISPYFVAAGPHTGCLWYGWKVTHTGSLDVKFYNLDQNFAFAEIDVSTGGSVRIVEGSTTADGWLVLDEVAMLNRGFYALPSIGQPLSTNRWEGLYVHGQSNDASGLFFTAGRVNLSACVLADAQLNFQDELSFVSVGLAIHHTVANGHNAIEMGFHGANIDSVVIDTTFWVYPQTSLDCLWINSGAQVNVEAMQVLPGYGTARNGIFLNRGVNGFIAKATGDASVLTGVGLQVANGAQAFVADPNSTTTIAGVGGAVIVGSNAVATWANIAGGTAALCTDYNAGSTGVATSQGCRVALA